MSLELNWYSDLKAESDLRRMAVVFEVVSVPLSKIDFKESQVNGARLKDAIRHHKVEDYMQGFRNGDTFPRPVVHKTPTGYVILSGNQRCEAIRRLAGLGEVPKTVAIEAYLVQTDDKLLLEIIARSANAAHGEGDTKEERIQQAIYCCRRLGLAVKDAAKSFLVSPQAINSNMRAEEQRTRLAKAGVDAHHISNAALEPLAKLEYDESAQTRLGTLVAQHAPPAERVKQIVASVAKQTSAPSRISLIRDFEKELSALAHSNGNGSAHASNGNSKVPVRPRRDKFISLLSRLVNFLESENDGEAFTSIAQLQIASNADTERVTALAKKLRYRLGVLVK